MIRAKWIILALALLALGLRAYRLEAQSLWSDEGLSLYRARLPLGENLTNIIIVPPNVPTQDTNPPLYFTLLSALRAVAGESEYALRFLSTMAGVALVPLLYVTGRRAFSSLSGVMAAALGALSPFLVWYSQEVRMYTLLVALSLTSVYLLLRALGIGNRPGDEGLRSKRQVGIWVIWVIVTAAALYTHFTAFFLLLFEALVAIAVLWRRRRPEAIMAGLAVVVVAIPIAAYAAARTASGVDPSFGFRTLDSIVEELAGSFSIGWTVEIYQPSWAVAPALSLFFVGALGGFVGRPRQIAPGMALLAHVAVVLLLFYAVAFIRPLYTGPRHLVLLAAPFYLLVGNGLAILWRRRRMVGVATLIWIVVTMLIWLRVQVSDPAYIKQDIRSVARVVSERARPDDVVIIHDAITSFVFDYYYDGPAQWHIIPAYPSHDVDAALAEFQARAESAARLWFVTDPKPLSGFDPAALDAWARGHLLRLDHDRFPAIWLGSAYQLYTARFPILDALPEAADPQDVAWHGGLRLVGVLPVGLESEESGDANYELSLFWVLDVPAQGNLVTTFRLVDQVGEERLRQGGKVFDNWSARRWPVGKIVRQDVSLVLPPDLPPGEYTVWLAVANRASEQMILTIDGSGDVEIASMAYPGGD